MDKKLQHPDAVLYQLYLLEQTGDPNSPYRDYLGLLPKTYTEFPMNWSDDEMAWLEGSPAK